MSREIRNGLFRYVRHKDVDAYLRRGWLVVGDLGPTHGQWSVLCWGCECALFLALNPADAAATHSIKED
jgi:hypothetical protein